MLTFVSPRDRVLLKLLKPKVAAWRWFTELRRLSGGDVLRHEYLERVLNDQIQNYDYYCVTGGFTFEDGQYLLKLQTADGGCVDRYCSSLLEVATIVSFKFRAWIGTEICFVPDFSTAALNATSPRDFLDRFLELRRAQKIDYIRRLWFTFLSTDRDSEESRQRQVRCLAGLVSVNYELLHLEADVGDETAAELEALGLDKHQVHQNAFESLRPLILKDLQLHKPHIYHLYEMCSDQSELCRLLSGDMGFLRAKRALMSADQLDYMLGSELGL